MAGEVCVLGFSRAFSYSERTIPPYVRKQPELLPAGWMAMIVPALSRMKNSSAPCQALLAMILMVFATGSTAAERSGEQIYRELCTSCHGMRGEGTKDQ